MNDKFYHWRETIGGRFNYYIGQRIGFQWGYDGNWWGLGRNKTKISDEPKTAQPNKYFIPIWPKGHIDPTEILLFFLVGAISALMFLWFGFEATAITLIVYFGLKVTSKRR